MHTISTGSLTRLSFWMQGESSGTDAWTSGSKIKHEGTYEYGRRDAVGRSQIYYRLLVLLTGGYICICARITVRLTKGKADRWVSGSMIVAPWSLTFHHLNTQLLCLFMSTLSGLVFLVIRQIKRRGKLSTGFGI